MIIYVLNISIIMLMYLFHRENNVKNVNISIQTTTTNKSSINKFKRSNLANFNIYFSIAFFSMWIVMTMRGMNVGYDTDDYYRGFLRIQSISWHQVFDFSQKNLVFNYERGFIILSKVLISLSYNYTMYLGFISAIILVPIKQTIQKYSPDPFLSLILFIALGFYHFDMSGIRQGIALSIGLFSYDLLNRKKYIKFIILILFASTIHSSIIFLIGAILLINIKITILKKILYYLFTITVYLLRVPIYNQIIILMGHESKVASNTGAYTLFLVVTIAFAASLLFYKKTTEYSDNNILVIYNLCAIGSTLMIFNTISHWSLRLTNYFYIFMILLIPLVVSSVKDRRLQMIYKTIILVFVLTYYFTGGYKYLGTGEYTFFWEW